MDLIRVERGFGCLIWFFVVGGIFSGFKFGFGWGSLFHLGVFFTPVNSFGPFGVQGRLELGTATSLWGFFPLFPLKSGGPSI